MMRQLRLRLSRSAPRPERRIPAGTDESRRRGRTLPSVLASFLACAALLAAFPAGSEAQAAGLQKCEAKGGKKTFSNVGAGAAGACTRSFPPRKEGRAAGKREDSSPKQTAAPARSRDYPKVTQSKQKQRDLMRLQVLEDELRTELNAATAYDEQIKTAQLTEEELGVMRKILENHILNIQAIQREIAGIK